MFTPSRLLGAAGHREDFGTRDRLEEEPENEPSPDGEDAIRGITLPEQRRRTGDVPLVSAPGAARPRLVHRAEHRLVVHRQDGDAGVALAHAAPGMLGDLL